MFIVRLLFVFAVLLGSTFLPTTPARAATSRTELKAREAFGASRYQEALDLYAKLYSEKLHPVYLRNIGRCYQNLGEPDKAISSFREYLRKAKQLSNEERTEVEGFITEMEQLKKQREATLHPVVEPAIKPAEPPPTLSPPPPLETNALTVSSGAASDSNNSEPSMLTKPWFWAVVGTVVAVGVLGGLAADGVFSSAKDEACPMGRICGQ